MILQAVKTENQPTEKVIDNLYLHYKSLGHNIELLKVQNNYFWTETKIHNPQARNIQEATVNWINSVYSLSAEEIP